MSGVLDESWTWKSWVEAANVAGCGFPLQNLPFCAFRMSDQQPHLGVGIGDRILDLHAASRIGLLKRLPKEVRFACRATYLNDLMECGDAGVARLRRALMAMLAEGADETQKEAVHRSLRAMEGTVFCKPVAIGDYTDFYASIHHATNVGRLFRPDQPLMPNYKWVPIGYHGRASSIVVSGTPVVRPQGQRKLPSAEAPEFGPSRQLDYELELGAYVGEGNALGYPIAIDDAERRIFGYSLVNDWSARDVQAWEYQPLGPFLGKNFATTVSPWVVTSEALAPFRVEMAARAEGDPRPLEYLAATDVQHAGISVQVEVWLSSEAMRAKGMEAVRLCAANARDLYWSFAQMVAHHTSNGCNLETGDLLASGTISGPGDGSRGCLLEMTRRGAEPVRLPTGEVRSFLEDGDEVTLRAFCEREGLPRIGFGECQGRIVPARLPTG
ncbi:MAG TPA: fumarylacetoacetase [Acidobacteriaceae bacterium]|jgi:fumarylacetoacetase|nr:fumarylacetoacetase [Acidobacteriaceae bacterium]